MGSRYCDGKMEDGVYGWGEEDLLTKNNNRKDSKTRNRPGGIACASSENVAKVESP